VLLFMLEYPKLKKDGKAAPSAPVYADQVKWM
jgi:hypothetical protein